MSIKYERELMQADAGASGTDLERGYVRLAPKPRRLGEFMREDSDGSTYEGDYFDRGGFMTRPRGWER